MVIIVSLDIYNNDLLIKFNELASCLNCTVQAGLSGPASHYAGLFARAAVGQVRSCTPLD